MWISRGFPPFPDKKVSLRLNCLWKQCGSRWISASPLGIWTLVRAGQGMHTWLAPMKTGHRVSNELPWHTILHTRHHNSAPEESRVSCVTPQGVWAWLPQALGHVPLPFAGINQSNEWTTCRALRDHLASRWTCEWSWTTWRHRSCQIAVPLFWDNEHYQMCNPFPLKIITKNN